MGFFEKLKQGLSKSRTNIFSRVNRLISARNKIDDEFLEELEAIFLSSDIGTQTTEILMQNVKNRAKEDKYIDTDELNSLLKDEIKKVLVGSDGQHINPYTIDKKPYLVMVVGVNGVGKTTSIGKLAYNYKNAGHSVLIAAADTFRAAANEQLDKWAKRAGCEIVQQSYGSDPGAVVYNAINSAINNNYDIIIVDTAGRLHTKVNLMEELKKINRVVKKILPDAPNETLLVVDATTGQNALNQSREFSNAIGVTGLILTKLDGTAKGGIVLRIGKELGIPVKYIGVGEQIDDLQVFNKEDFVKALLED